MDQNETPKTMKSRKKKETRTNCGEKFDVCTQGVQLFSSICCMGVYNKEKCHKTSNCLCGVSEWKSTAKCFGL
jgi:hypothetical protein